MKLRKDNGVSRPLKSSFHQSMVGNLLSAATATRPDLAEAASAAFSANTNAAHLTAVKRILRYSKGTVKLGLKYALWQKGTLTGFSDADLAVDQDDRQSATGNVF